MTVAYGLAVTPPGGVRTWTVIDASYQTVRPVEEWLEAHRHLWSPNTVRGYATSLAQWWTFLEQRGEADRWQEIDVPAVTAFLSWLRNGRTAGRALAGPAEVPSAGTLEARLAALISFYRWQEAVYSVPAGGRLMRGAPRRRPARGLLAHLDARSAPGPSSLVRVRRGGRRDRPPLLLPREIQAILDGCAVFDEAAGEWAGNLRDRLLFSLLAESGMRLGEALGMRISDFVMGRGGTAYIEIVPRPGNPNGARVKMMRPRRVYVGGDLERLFADYLTRLACCAARAGHRRHRGLAAAGEPGTPAAAGRDARRDRPGQGHVAAGQGHRPAGMDAALVQAFPCLGSAAGRDPGLGGLPAAGSRPRPDHAGPVWLGPGRRCATGRGELAVLCGCLAGER
jgi:integrase